MTDYRIVEDDLTAPPVLALLEFHRGEMHRLSPPSNVHALPVERLRQPDVTFFSAWEGDSLPAVGAMRELSPERAEIKSMRASPVFRGNGAGVAILVHLITESERRGYRSLGLETAWAEAWASARALCRKHGFGECGDFGDFDDYIGSEFSLCMGLEV